MDERWPGGGDTQVRCIDLRDTIDWIAQIVINFSDLLMFRGGRDGTADEEAVI